MTVLAAGFCFNPDSAELSMLAMLSLRAADGASVTKDIHTARADLGGSWHSHCPARDSVLKGLGAERPAFHTAPRRVLRKRLAEAGGGTSL